MRKKMLGYIAASIAFFMTVPSTAFAAGFSETLNLGDKDDSVVQLQQALKQKGFFDSDVTGYYGNETKQAVIQYQIKNGLTADGTVGPDTSESIFGEDYTALLASIAQPKDGTSPALSPGDSGDAVVLLQKRLSGLEYYNYDTITGYYGPVTEDAVEKFQTTQELHVTGVADMDTLSALFSDSASSYIMSAGDNGSDVQKLQDRLHALGYLVSDSTGYYGDLTVAAVEQFQKSSGLDVDGKAGKETRSALFSDNAPSFSGVDDTIPAGAPATQSKSAVIDKSVEFAYSLLGKDYIYGASGPNSFDCSGFIYYILSNAGLPVNKMSPAAFSNVDGWQTVTVIESLEIGDLVFFKSDTGASINHMGIYVGGGSFIHASQSIGSVTTSTMTSGYYNSHFIFAKRFA